VDVTTISIISSYCKSDSQCILVSLGVHFDAAINTNAVRPGETPE